VRVREEEERGGRKFGLLYEFWWAVVGFKNG
jgi:hypothetical protein